MEPEYPVIVFVLNRGSSSIKCFLYRVENRQPSLLWDARIQWKGAFESPQYFIKDSQGAPLTQPLRASSPTQALQDLLAHLVEGPEAPLRSLEQIDAFGHRIVHGGPTFSHSVLITPDVIHQLRRIAPLAPLHNPPALEALHLLQTLFPRKPHIAVFDTAFHHTLPTSARVYPGPHKWIEEGIQRYGFHGINYQYCTRRASQLLNPPPKALLLCHLGAGASLCAVKEGESIDTTMGYTPLEGLMMNTRSGSIDPGILLHLLETRNPKALAQELYEQSGLLGLSQISPDLCDVIRASQADHKQAQLALDVYLHRLYSLMGSMIASLRGLDALVFTAGNGENSPFLREHVCSHFSFLGLRLDPHKNGLSSLEDRLISSPDSTASVLVIRAQEALEIALECQRRLFS